MSLNNHQKAVLSLIFANIIWGAASPIFKWSLTNIEPFTLAFFRFFLGALIFLPFVLHNLKIKKQDTFYFLALSIFGITFNISFFFLGLELTSSINAPIIATSGPIFLLFACFFYLKEKIKPRAILGTIIGTIGVSMVILRPIIENGFDMALVGNLLLVLATIAGVAHTIMVKKIVENYNAKTITFWAFLIGAITFIPFFLIEITQNGFLTNISLPGISGIIYGSIFSSALAYYLFYESIKNLKASEVGIFAYLDPFAALIVAYPLLGEKPTLIYGLGALLVFLGILIAEKRLPYHPFQLLKKIVDLEK